MFVNFTDSTQTVISQVFPGPQSAAVYPNAGTVTASDERWAAFYPTLPTSAQAQYTPPTTPAAPPLAQQAADLIAGGIVITSTINPCLNGTYTIQSGVPYGREDIANEAQFISTYSEFTNGSATTTEWPLQNGSMVTFTSTAQFLAFAKAVAQLISAVKSALTANAAGVSVALPSPDFPIA